jgi:hypothetical protein
LFPIRVFGATLVEIDADFKLGRGNGRDWPTAWMMLAPVRVAVVPAGSPALESTFSTAFIPTANSEQSFHGAVTLSRRKSAAVPAGTAARTVRIVKLYKVPIPPHVALLRPQAVLLETKHLPNPFYQFHRSSLQNNMSNAHIIFRKWRFLTRAFLENNTPISA